jgi:hypothetical protein
MKSSFMDRYGRALDGMAVFVAGLCVGVVAATCFFFVCAQYMLPHT